MYHPNRWHVDGTRMAENVHQLRLKPGDSEKITINVGYVDLGHIDLMVQEGFYSNRSDFIRTAIRNQLERHADVVKQSTAETVLTSVCGTTAARISKRRGEPVRCCTSMFWALPVSPKTSRPSLLALQLPQSPCWEHCMPVRRSKPLSPIGRGEGDAETGPNSRSHTPHARGPTRRGHRAPSAHAS